MRFELTHGRGETDDATFVWLPEKGVLVSGDFVIWVFPNAGNPRKVQRFAPDWAVALRRMQALAAGRPDPRPWSGSVRRRTRRANSPERGRGAGKPRHADHGT